MRLSRFCTVVLVIFLVLGAELKADACYGARALGMGGAFTALADGSLAVYWNQAGLGFTETNYQSSITLTIPEDNINYNTFAATTARAGDHVYGVGVTRLAPWAGNETWLTFAMGTKIGENLALGGAFRTISGYNIRSYESSGFDLSAQYRQGQLYLGLLIQDVGGPNAHNLYTMNVRPSIALKTDRLTLALDIYQANNLDEIFLGEKEYYNHQVGLEYRPLGPEGWLHLRGGFYHGKVTAGIGIKGETFSGDVVLIPEWEVVQISIEIGL